LSSEFLKTKSGIERREKKCLLLSSSRAILSWLMASLMPLVLVLSNMPRLKVERSIKSQKDVALSIGTDPTECNTGNDNGDILAPLP
jgi:hypothetical protein